MPNYNRWRPEKLKELWENSKSIRIHNLWPGDKVIVHGLTCLNDLTVKTVKHHKAGLYVDCNVGKHFLDGQIGPGGWLIGVRFITQQEKQ